MNCMNQTLGYGPAEIMGNYPFRVVIQFWPAVSRENFPSKIRAVIPPESCWERHLHHLLPSGKHTKNYGKSPCFFMENPLFQWPFSIANCWHNQRVTPQTLCHPVPVVKTHHLRGLQFVFFSLQAASSIAFVLWNFSIPTKVATKWLKQSSDNNR